MPFHSGAWGYKLGTRFYALIGVSHPEWAESDLEVIGGQSRRQALVFLAGRAKCLHSGMCIPPIGPPSVDALPNEPWQLV
jgi:hypothetical protein